MMRCLAVDDEGLALEVLENYIGKVPFLELVQCCNSPLQTLQVLTQTRIDLLFLDIQMPDLSGLQLLRTLKDPPLVVLTTAHAGFALEGYELDVTDYLLKPIPFDRFLLAAGKARRKHELETRPAESTVPDDPGESLFIKSDSRIIRISLSDILYIEGKKDYVLIATPDKKWITHLTLSRLEELLPGGRFVRIHRSCIVSLHRLDSLDRHQVQIGDKHLPIGDYYRERLLQQTGQV